MNGGTRSAGSPSPRPIAHRGSVAAGAATLEAQQHAHRYAEHPVRRRVAIPHFAGHSGAFDCQMGRPERL